MRTLPFLSLALLLAACGSDESPDDGVSTAGSISEDATAGDDVSTAGSAAPASSADLANLDGDWVYCGGPSALDESATFEGTTVRTYLHDRPAASMPVQIQDDKLTLDDGRSYFGKVEGDVLRLTGDDGTAIYARSATACP